MVHHRTNSKFETCKPIPQKQTRAMIFFQKTNPRTQALIAVGAVITLLTLLFLFIFIKQQKQALSDTIHSEQHSLQKQTKLLMDQTSKNYKSRIKSLTTNRIEVMEAFAAGDRDELLQQASELFEIFKKENSDFESLFFIKPDNIVFLRAQNPGLHGDDISLLSPIVQESNHTQKMLDGFEIVKGGLQYRIVNPVFTDNKFIGIIGFGLDAKFFLDQLHEASHDHLHKHSTQEAGTALIFPKTELTKIIFLDKPYKLVGNYAVSDCGNPNFQKLPDHLDLGKKIQKIKLNGENHALIHSSDFKNFKGTIIATGLSLVNIKNITSRTKRGIVLTILFALGLILLAFVILYFNFNILFKKIITLNNSLENSNKDLENKIEERTAEVRESEERLKKSEERLKAIFLANPDPVAVYDVEGYPLYLNPAFTRVFGWSLDELQDKLIPFVPKDQQEKVKSKIQKVYESGSPVQFETTRLSKGGKTIDILLSAAIIKDIQGIHNGLVVNLKDITDKKKLENQLQQAQKMEAIGTLAGGIAHDFNNILSGIFGFAQLAKSHMTDHEKANKDIDRIVEGAQKASDLVQQILTFSRKTSNEKQPLILSIVIKEALKLLRASIPATIEIKENINSQAAVMADSTKIHQVMMNLCTNAFHSMQETGGVLTVGVTNEKISGQNHIPGSKMLSGEYLKIEVSDTGPGMDPKILDNIFDPYFTTKEPGKGTGMGLAVVHGIIEEHKGHIQVRNKSGKGSSFYVYLPVSKRLVPPIPKTKKDILPGGSERIMVIDDEETILEVTKIFLELYGYKVHPFSDGGTALEVFKKDPCLFDLIITDMTMPGMTGEKLSMEMLKIRSNIPIFLCSGYNEKISGDKALEMGIRKYLKKPFPLNVLAKKIRDTLDSDTRT